MQFSSRGPVNGMEMCILQQNKLVSFADKMSLLKKRPVVPRCLFGPPDPAENQRLFQEEMQRERDRFQRRFNIDLDAVEDSIEKTRSRKCEEEPRIPPLPADLEERLQTAAPLEKDAKSARSVPGCVLERKCRKPCSKFQKRVRVSGLKRQTHLTG